MKSEKKTRQEPRQAEVHFPIGKRVREEASQAGGEEAESRNGDDHAGAQALVLAHRDQNSRKRDQFSKSQKTNLKFKVNFFF